MGVITSSRISPIERRSAGHIPPAPTSDSPPVNPGRPQTRLEHPRRGRVLLRPGKQKKQRQQKHANGSETSEFSGDRTLARSCVALKLATKISLGCRLSEKDSVGRICRSVFFSNMLC
jgi:hypothetical protein